VTALATAALAIRARHDRLHRDRAQPTNVRTLLKLYSVMDAERDGLIQLTRKARQPGGDIPSVTPCRTRTRSI
jgi:hypothetical protein